MDRELDLPENGILVHGLFMDGFRWSDEDACLGEAIPGEMVARLPMMHMLPVMDHVVDDKEYPSPLYKTSARAGTLSTTGKWGE